MTGRPFYCYLEYCWRFLFNFMSLAPPVGPAVPLCCSFLSFAGKYTCSNSLSSFSSRLFGLFWYLVHFVNILYLMVEEIEE